MKDQEYDIVIIGGSYAGLSAAMATGRALKKVLIIDSGKPCNRQTPYSHNFITHDGATPSFVAQQAKKQVLAYPTVKFLNDNVSEVTGSDMNFTVVTDTNGAFTAKKLLFATGIKDIMPNIDGFAECWGISVIHCPFCHGYEYRGKRTGVLMQGEMAIDHSKFISNWTKDLTLFTNGASNFTDEERARLKVLNIELVEKEIKSLDHREGYLKNVVFTDDTRAELDALYAHLPFVQHTGIPQQLGCEINEQGYIVIDDLKKTTVPGVFAAGDNTTRMRMLAAAVAAGTIAGAMMSRELILES